MKVLDFGRQLIETRDLDPVYVVLWEAQLGEQLYDWLLAYWCFYHMGTANWICSQPDYWIAFAYAASNKEHPRSSERRHFRGKNAVESVAYLRSLKKTPRQVIEAFCTCRSLVGFMTNVRRVRGFGDWIAFKVADMMERLDIYPVEFSPQDVFNMYESPREGAEIVARQYRYKGDACGFAYAFLSRQLKDMLAPPRYERSINIQEIETILCKYKSHCSGHYSKPGKDIHEVYEGLQRYKTLELSQRMLDAGRSLW